MRWNVDTELLVMLHAKTKALNKYLNQSLHYNSEVIQRKTMERTTLNTYRLYQLQRYYPQSHLDNLQEEGTQSYSLFLESAQ